MADLYYLSRPTSPNRGTVRIRHGGRPDWAFFEQCEDGLALLCKPAVLYVTLVQEGAVTKIRAVRFRKQENLNSWVSSHLSGLRSEGYDVHYMD